MDIDKKKIGTIYIVFIPLYLYYRSIGEQYTKAQGAHKSKGKNRSSQSTAKSRNAPFGQNSPIDKPGILKCIVTLHKK